MGISCKTYSCSSLTFHSLWGCSRKSQTPTLGDSKGTILLLKSHHSPSGHGLLKYRTLTFICQRSHPVPQPFLCHADVMASEKRLLASWWNRKRSVPSALWTLADVAGAVWHPRASCCWREVEQHLRGPAGAWQYPPPWKPRLPRAALWWLL